MPASTIPLSTTGVSFVSDDATITGFLAEPAASRTRGPAVVVLHEWWGLNDHIKHIARRFAEAGYVALVPDLYSRQGHQVTHDANEAAKLMDGLSSQLVLRDLNAATGFLKQQHSVDPWRLGVVGFCMGGTLAFNQAEHNSDLKAAVIFYGKVPPIESFDYLLCPILYHYGEQDGWVTKQEVERVRQGLAQYGKPGEVITYPNGAHAFFNDTRPDVYSERDARLAWDRTLQFFKRHLRG